MSPPPIDPIASARRVFQIEAQAVAALAANLDQNFEGAVHALLEADGRAVVCGMGKSGIVGRKIAATLSSTGTPSFFMHPGEAYHGDLGMVTTGDVFVAISNSGETDEVIKLLPFLRANGNVLIAMTSNPESSLGRASSCHLDISVEREACPLQLAPTSSTTAALAMGDALAVALMDARQFQPESFARFHPGGSLGRRLLSRVEDEMLSENLPIITPDDLAMTVISTITSSKLGLAVIHVGDDWGIVTDGDLRRALERFGPTLFARTARDFMSRNPASVAIGTRMEDAIAKMEREQISSLLVFDGEELVGVLKK
jgi:arabinose-5-phosphate isomerase